MGTFGMVQEVSEILSRRTSNWIQVRSPSRDALSTQFCHSPKIIRLKVDHCSLQQLVNALKKSFGSNLVYGAVIVAKNIDFKLRSL